MLSVPFRAAVLSIDRRFNARRAARLPHTGAENCCLVCWRSARLLRSTNALEPWSLAPAGAPLTRGAARPIARGGSPHWVEVKNPAVPAVKREAEEEWR